MKKRITFIATVVICLAILATGTLAYFTDAQQVHNIITSGNIKIALEEFFPDAVPGEEENTMVLTGVVPGQTITKEVRVQNTGVGDAWMRVRLTTRFENADLATQINGKDVVSIGLLDGWTEGDDGWYYYNEIVSAQDYTTHLFKEVTFAPEMGNEYQNQSVSIFVEAEAVQAANNGTDVMDAAGWPSES